MLITVSCNSWKSKYIDSVSLEIPNSFYAYLASANHISALKTAYKNKNTVIVMFDFENHKIVSVDYELVYAFTKFGSLVSYHSSDFSLIGDLLIGLQLKDVDFGNEDTSNGSGVVRIELNKLWKQDKLSY